MTKSDQIMEALTARYYEYTVLSDGRILSLRGAPLKPHAREDGFLTVRLRINGKMITKRVVRVVLEAFVGKCQDGCEASHKDGDRSNNAISNVEWAARKGNPKRLWERLHLKKPPMTMDEIFFKSDAEPNSGCWIWGGYTNSAAYAIISINRKPYFLSRYVLEKKLGRPIKGGYLACHTCDNPSCVNPDHLWEGTTQDNAMDMTKKGRNKFRVKYGIYPSEAIS